MARSVDSGGLWKCSVRVSMTRLHEQDVGESNSPVAVPVVDEPGPGPRRVRPSRKEGKAGGRENLRL